MNSSHFENHLRKHLFIYIPIHHLSGGSDLGMSLLDFIAGLCESKVSVLAQLYLTMVVQFPHGETGMRSQNVPASSVAGP